MRLCLYEDRRTTDLFPLTLTRPVFDLLCGLTPLGEKHARYFAADSVGYWVRPLVADLTREGRPYAPVNDPLWLRAGPTVLANARWIPPARSANDPPLSGPDLFHDGPFLAVCDGELAFAAVTPEMLAAVTPGTLDDVLEDWLSVLPREEVGGLIVRRPWDLVERNRAQIVADYPGFYDPERVGSRPNGVAIVGCADRLFVNPTAMIDPMVVIDTTHGPVVLDAGAVVTAFTRLEGPCYIGEGTHVLGAKVKAGTSIGPHCRIGGEVEASIIQGYTNKAHEGFLGHSFVGEWVNLAAGTHTSNLRTDYGLITVPGDGTTIQTGRIKVGSFFGDHVKTGLGVLLNCGSVIGAFATILPTGRLSPRDIPSFAKASVEGIHEDLGYEAHFTTAEVMMHRRGRAMTRAQEAVYRAVAAQTTTHRRRIVTGEEPARQRRTG